MTRSEDLGKLVLRVALGVLILLHGIAKLGKGVDGIGGMLAAHGLPAVLAYGVYLGELVAPALVIIGMFTRPAACVIAINMVVAIWLAHAKQLTSLSSNGGWALELQGMFLFSAIAVALIGGGRIGVGGRFN
ncbi:DoxX family protein [Xenophilus arseniciresistens]|uniref:DoxX family protein n=1 Tax=Xenophilus arseniciresistens TaxID=1283306 RepID=A0AAE3N7N7_9BURK|nr:DoxX family protein [Xenophilus arseniciresistens]MDA7415871.1 DoxX family protein [Xenophilus arseniciresistens]